jgi:hypothetical protein
MGKKKKPKNLKSTMFLPGISDLASKEIKIQKSTYHREHKEETKKYRNFFLVLK